MIKSSELVGSGSAYILELEQIHVRKSCQLRYAHFSGHKKTYFLLSEGSKSLIITFFLFPELNSIKNITMLKDYLITLMEKILICKYRSFLKIVKDSWKSVT